MKMGTLSGDDRLILRGNLRPKYFRTYEVLCNNLINYLKLSLQVPYSSKDLQSFATDPEGNN